MIVELGVAIGCTYIYNYFISSDERKFKDDFKDILINAGITNKSGNTFTIEKLEITSCGYSAQVNIPKGLGFEQLKNKINILEDNLNACVELEKNKLEPYIKMIVNTNKHK